MSDTGSPRWSDLKEKGGTLPLMLMLWFYRLGGRFLCRIVLYFVIMWYWLFSKIAKQASLEYLSKLHQFAGEQSPFSQTPTLANSYTHLMQFGECMARRVRR